MSQLVIHQANLFGRVLHVHSHASPWRYLPFSLQTCITMELSTIQAPRIDAIKPVATGDRRRTPTPPCATESTML
jgi:hypothetical protein